MVREKVVLGGDPVRVEYGPDRFRLLEELRERARSVLEVVCRLGEAGVYGSVARGDVHSGSDVDVVLLNPPNQFAALLALEDAGFAITHREMVMASPNSPVKAHVGLGEGRTLSFPLLPLKRREEEFYFFGGYLDLEGLGVKRRVRGVDKRLLLIEPDDSGHTESPVAGNERVAARLLGVGTDLVDERIRVLSRRDSVGRTGVYLRCPLGPGEDFGSCLTGLAHRDANIRRQVKQRRPNMV